MLVSLVNVCVYVCSVCMSHEPRWGAKVGWQKLRRHSIEILYVNRTII